VKGGKREPEHELLSRVSWVETFASNEKTPQYNHEARKGGLRTLALGERDAKVSVSEGHGLASAGSNLLQCPNRKTSAGLTRTSQLLPTARKRKEEEGK